MTDIIDIQFTLNDKPVRARAPSNMLLVSLLRDRFGLTGTKIGCGRGECGACSVLLDGQTVNSCLMLACQADGRSITTIEGLSPDGLPTLLQRAFVEEGAVQCGFCTPGMIISAYALLKENRQPSTEQIRMAISGNLCRCTGYKQIEAAILEASKKLDADLNLKEL